MTWEKVAQQGAERDFNAAILSAVGHDVALSRHDGTERAVQRNVAESPAFQSLLGSIVLAVEEPPVEEGAKGLECFSISCHRGRHRSVALAELLRDHFYPAATLTHLTLKSR